MARILFAEDDQALRAVLALNLERAGHRVTAVSDGTDALAQLQRDTDYDLLLTDVLMPELDGIALSRHARALAPHMRIVFITGFAAVATRASQSIDRAHVLSKPFHLRDLTTQIDAILAE